MLTYGTQIVAGVTPGKGGKSYLNIPVFDSVKEALATHPEINTSILFVPAKFCRKAALEAINLDIPLLVIITEGIPILDSLEIVNRAQEKGIYVIGPNCPGIISPKYRCKVGIMPAEFFPPGKVGIISRSGTLSYEIALAVKQAGLGISTAIGIGGDPIIGPSMVEALARFESDDQTTLIIIIGEIGGAQEEKAAEYIKEKSTKPVLAFIAGQTIAMKGKRFGHAGALITASGIGTAQDKVKAFESAGVKVAINPTAMQELLLSYKR
jgi:succinyl-CoA synthetase alpha subunit